MPANDLSGPSSPQDGIEFTWPAEISIEDILRLPATMAALRSGRIDLARAKLIEIFTTGLDDDLAGLVERMVPDKAEHQTTGQLQAALQRAVIAVDPAAAERRREQAERNAHVELSGDPESTGSLAGRFLPQDMRRPRGPGSAHWRRRWRVPERRAG